MLKKAYHNARKWQTKTEESPRYAQPRIPVSVNCHVFSCRRSAVPNPPFSSMHRLRQMVLVEYSGERHLPYLSPIHEMSG